MNADEAAASQLAVGQTAKLTVESYPQSTFQGVVKAIAPVLDPHTRTVAVEVEIGDPQGKLKPGMYSQMAIQTEVHQNALLVPREAVVHAPPSDGAPPQTLVYVVVESRLRRQKVSLGAGDDKNVEILQGLSEGDNVVLNPGNDLIDGQLYLGYVSCSAVAGRPSGRCCRYRCEHGSWLKKRRPWAGH